MSYHETIDDTWIRINSIQTELDDLDEEKNVHQEATLNTSLVVDSRFMERIEESHVPLDASKTIATKDSDSSTRCNITLIEQQQENLIRADHRGELSLPIKYKTPRRV